MYWYKKILKIYYLNIFSIKYFYIKILSTTLSIKYMEKGEDIH
jgi:hypothetical protein